MVHKNKEDAYPKLLAAVLEVCQKHEADKVLAHTVNYDLTNFLAKELGGKLSQRVYSYSKRDEKQRAVDSYVHSSDPCVLFAPSLERGIDLPNDLCSAIIICKVPYPSLGDKQISQRLYGTGAAGKLWYSCETIRALVQMTGRGMRHEDDYCESYILDSQFMDNIWRRSRQLIPEWWREAVHIRKDGL